MKHVYVVEGIHCQACTEKIATALRRVPGVTAASATVTPPQATVEMDRSIPLAALQSAVSSAGDYTLRETGESSPAPLPTDGPAEKKESLYPLILIVAYLTGTVLVIEIAAGEFNLHRFMRGFMGGFFLVFSFFKFLDLRGFADVYRTYDILAQAVPVWAWLYPFAELGLGIAYVLGWQLTATSIITMAVMLIGAAGVLRALRQRRGIRCACLGAVLNLPMTTVTLIEDLGMAAMAGAMLLLG